MNKFHMSYYIIVIRRFLVNKLRTNYWVSWKFEFPNYFYLHRSKKLILYDFSKLNFANIWQYKAVAYWRGHEFAPPPFKIVVTQNTTIHQKCPKLNKKEALDICESLCVTPSLSQIGSSFLTYTPSHKISFDNS